MQERSIVERVEVLERKVKALESLPDRVTRVELQLVQLRNEMRAEFSAIRGGAGEDVTLSTLRQEIRAGDEETRRYMRMLHEDVIARLAIIQEGQRPRKKR